MPLQLHVHIVMKVSKGGRRPSPAEGSTIGAMKCQLGIAQHLPLLCGEPEHEGVRSKPVKNCATQSEQRPGLVHGRGVGGQTPNRLGGSPVTCTGVVLLANIRMACPGFDTKPDNNNCSNLEALS